MTFWEKNTNQSVKPWEQPAQQIVLDEQAVAAIQEDPNIDLFEEEDQDTAELMSDANLRLEQGRLYQMVLQGDIFADTNADPRAIKNVQREIRKYVRERMETMLGIRQEQQAQTTIVSSPFNDMEVTVLKMLASRASKGATESSQPQIQKESSPPPTPKKDGITSISGSLRPSAPAPLVSNKSPVQKKSVQPSLKSQAKSAIKAEESVLEKPIDQMTAEELAAHDAAALARRSKNYAAMPTNMVPHPSGAALEMLYATQVQQATSGPLGNLLALTNR